MIMRFAGAVALFFVVACASAPFEVGSCENDLARIDADFDGAGMAACQAKKDKFVLRIEPEDQPINPSAWYAFRVTPKQAGETRVVLRYGDAWHRYAPKRSADGETWRLVDPSRVTEKRKGRVAELRLAMDASPFFVAGQEFFLGADYDAWMDAIAASGGYRTADIGASLEGRPIRALFSDPAADGPIKEYVLLVGRQHPPEVTGAMAMLPFLDTVFGDTPLAREFRARFHVIAVPLMNPDGVANGHWRHNMGGVDLNRDWGPFTQPETQAVQRVMDEIAADPDSALRLMLDFHSTNRNVFYVQPDEEPTVPANFTSDWLGGARARLDDYEFERADRPLGDKPISKNYVYREFGAPAITFEIGDDTDRDAIRAAAPVFAEEMMKTMLASPAGEPAAGAAAD